MFPPKDEKLLRLRPLCLIPSCDSSIFRVMARITLPSYLIPERTELEREHFDPGDKEHEQVITG